WEAAGDPPDLGGRRHARRVCCGGPPRHGTADGNPGNSRIRRAAPALRATGRRAGSGGRERRGRRSGQLEGPRNKPAGSRVNRGATATAVPPCDPATSCRPGVTPADAQTPNGRIDSADAVAVASVVVGVSVPVVGQLVPTASVTPDTAVASVTISPAPASVQVGQTLQLTATPKDSAGGILVGRTVTWASGNPSIATVSPSGQVTGAAPGAAPITATSEGKSGTATLTVTTVPVASVPLSPATATVLVGQTLQLTATPKDSAGGALTGRSVTWVSGYAGVGVVSSR